MIKRAICQMCPNHGCGILFHIENGEAIRVKGDPAHPLSKGYLCVKGKASLEHLYHKDRLKYPLKRVGPRGSDKWERVSWEKALDEIAEKIKGIKDKYGSESIASSQGTYRTHDFARKRFMNLLGSPNIIASGTQVCLANDIIIEMVTYGAFWFGSDYENARCVVFWGSNPANSMITSYRRILKARRERKIKILVVDPRFTETARMADIWLQPRPCTDTALILGWLNVIINEKLYDSEFVGKWTVGFDKLVERVQEYPPEKVEEITWVPKEKIIESARMFATNKPADIDWGAKGDQLGRNTTQFIRARAILRAITGNLDIVGGHILPGCPPKWIGEADFEANDKLQSEQKKKALGHDKFKLFSWDVWAEINEHRRKVYRQDYTLSSVWITNAHSPTLWRTILTSKPYPIKALITAANNPLVAFANSKLVYDDLKKLELFIVFDRFMTPSAILADYVLPCESGYERPFIDTQSGLYEYVITGDKVIEPLWESRTDFDFFRGLGIRLGQDWPWITLEELLDEQTRPLGYTWEEFVTKVKWLIPPHEYKRHERTGFATRSGKVEIYSSVFEELGYDSLPNYEEPAISPIRTPDRAKEYPFILTTGGKILQFTHSEHRQIKTLRKRYRDPIATVNTETAAELGISDGDWVWIETPLGKVKQKARLSSGILRNVVHAEHGWWFAEDPGEEPHLFGVWKSNINVVIDDDPDTCDLPIGSWQLQGQLCKIYKVT